MNEFKNYPSIQNSNVQWMKPSEITIPQDFYDRKEKENKLKKQKKFKGKTPIECLEINGYEVLRDLNDNVVVGLDESSDFLEGIFKERDEEIKMENLFSVPQSKITDYNSLWEISCSGWDSYKNKLFKGNTLYPYLFLTKKGSNSEISCWRWDNSDFLRVNCLTHNWSEENYEKHRNSWEYKRVMEESEKRNKYHRKEKVGRNDKCSCGSGLKYKKCCLNKK